MKQEDVNPFHQAMARICELCPVCRHARKSQKGLAYDFVKNVEESVCPFCQAYELVYDRKAHELKD